MSDAPTCPKCNDNTMKPRSKSPAGAVRWECRKNVGGEEVYCYSTTNPDSGAHMSNGRSSDGPAIFDRKLNPKAKIYIITSAQNGTPVHRDFWGGLLQLKKHRKAELVVIPNRYKNPTSKWTESQANEEVWAEDVQPYLYNQRFDLNPNLVLLGNAPVQSTAKNPIEGFESMTGSSSGIIGHPQIQLKCVATPAHNMAKIMTTTGSCTVQNYSSSKAGVIGAFHHSLAAVIVEVVDRKFFIRHVNFDTKTKSFTDIDKRYTAKGVTKAPRAKALVMGDTHVDFINPLVKNALFGKGGMVEILKPEHLVWHDTLDAYAVNPHHRGNPFVAHAKIQSGRGNILEEVRRACKFVKEHTPKDCLSVVVESNHDDFLRRWVIDADWKKDAIGNALFYLRTATEMLENTRYIEGYGTWYPSPFPMIFPRLVDTSNIKVLHSKINPETGTPELEPFPLLNIELGMHGDQGPSGTRGSINNLKRIGVKSIIGHAHSPGIAEGCYQVGTSTNLRLEYNSGPGAWLNSHCILHQDGKRQLIIVVDGEWRG